MNSLTAQMSTIHSALHAVNDVTNSVTSDELEVTKTLYELLCQAEEKNSSHFIDKTVPKLVTNEVAEVKVTIDEVVTAVEIAATTRVFDKSNGVKRKSKEVGVESGFDKDIGVVERTVNEVVGRVKRTIEREASHVAVDESKLEEFVAVTNACEQVKTVEILFSSDPAGFVEKVTDAGSDETEVKVISADEVVDEGNETMLNVVDSTDEVTSTAEAIAEIIDKIEASEIKVEDVAESAIAIVEEEIGFVQVDDVAGFASHDVQSETISVDKPVAAMLTLVDEKIAANVEHVNTTKVTTGEENKIVRVNMETSGEEEEVIPIERVKDAIVYAKVAASKETAMTGADRVEVEAEQTLETNVEPVKVPICTTPPHMPSTASVTPAVDKVEASSSTKKEKEASLKAKTTVKDNVEIVRDASDKSQICEKDIAGTGVVSTIVKDLPVASLGSAEVCVDESTNEVSSVVASLVQNETATTVKNVVGQIVQELVLKTHLTGDDDSVVTCDKLEEEVSLSLDPDAVATVYRDVSETTLADGDQVHGAATDKVVDEMVYAIVDEIVTTASTRRDLFVYDANQATVASALNNDLVDFSFTMEERTFETNGVNIEDSKAAHETKPVQEVDEEVILREDLSEKESEFLAINNVDERLSNELKYATGFDADANVAAFGKDGIVSSVTTPVAGRIDDQPTAVDDCVVDKEETAEAARAQVELCDLIEDGEGVTLVDKTFVHGRKCIQLAGAASVLENEVDSLEVSADIPQISLVKSKKKVKMEREPAETKDASQMMSTTLEEFEKTKSIAEIKSEEECETEDNEKATTEKAASHERHAAFEAFTEHVITQPDRVDAIQENAHSDLDDKEDVAVAAGVPIEALSTVSDDIDNALTAKQVFTKTDVEDSLEVDSASDDEVSAKQEDSLDVGFAPVMANKEHTDEKINIDSSIDVVALPVDVATASKSTVKKESTCDDVSKEAIATESVLKEVAIYEVNIAANGEVDNEDVVDKPHKEAEICDVAAVSYEKTVVTESDTPGDGMVEADTTELKSDTATGVEDFLSFERETETDENIEGKIENEVSLEADVNDIKTGATDIQENFDANVEVARGESMCATVANANEEKDVDSEPAGDLGSTDKQGFNEMPKQEAPLLADSNSAPTTKDEPTPAMSESVFAVVPVENKPIQVDSAMSTDDVCLKEIMKSRDQFEVDTKPISAVSMLIGRFEQIAKRNANDAASWRISSRTSSRPSSPITSSSSPLSREHVVVDTTTSVKATESKLADGHMIEKIAETKAVKDKDAENAKAPPERDDEAPAFETAPDKESVVEIFSAAEETAEAAEKTAATTSVDETIVKSQLEAAAIETDAEELVATPEVALQDSEGAPVADVEVHSIEDITEVEPEVEKIVANEIVSIEKDIQFEDKDIELETAAKDENDPEAAQEAEAATTFSLQEADMTFKEVPVSGETAVELAETGVDVNKSVMNITTIKAAVDEVDDAEPSETITAVEDVIEDTLPTAISPVEIKEVATTADFTSDRMIEGSTSSNHQSEENSSDLASAKKLPADHNEPEDVSQEKPHSAERKMSSAIPEVPNMEIDDDAVVIKDLAKATDEVVPFSQGPTSFPDDVTAGESSPERDSSQLSLCERLTYDILGVTRANNVIMYHIHTFDRSTGERVMSTPKRYSEFKQLDEQLRALDVPSVHDIPLLPKSSVRSFLRGRRSKKTIEVREKAFREYLIYVRDHKDLHESAVFRQFIAK